MPVLSFSDPLVLFLFIPLIFLLILQRLWQGRGGRLQFSLGSWKGPSFQYNPFYLKLLLFLRNLGSALALALIIFALSGPSILTREQVFLSRGTNFMVVLDVSPTMMGQDFAPETRLDSALRVIEQFVETRDKDPIGLVSFATYATLRVPPTIDYAFLKEQLSHVGVDSGTDTAIGMGIALGSLHLQGAPSGERIMILLSDGDNNFGEILPETAAEMAATLGIKIYTIGIGTERKVDLEFTNQETGRMVIATIEDSFDEEILKRIARVTGGSYYPARSMGSLENVFRSIDSQESQEKQIRQAVRTHPIHRQMIILALGIFFLVFLMNKTVLREVF